MRKSTPFVYNPLNLEHDPRTEMIPTIFRRFEGIWRGEGVGEFPPRVAPFQYIEELVIKPLSKPNVWECRSQTRNKVTDKPMHIETGFMRAHPGEPQGECGRVEFVISHPFGLAEVSQGNYTSDMIEVTCRSEGFSRVATATPPQVTELRRVYRFVVAEDGCSYLEFLFEMGTTLTAMQTHLVAKLKKVA